MAGGLSLIEQVGSDEPIQLPVAGGGTAFIQHRDSIIKEGRSRIGASKRLKRR